MHVNFCKPVIATEIIVFKEKDLVSAMPSPPLSYLQRWIEDSKELRLIKNDKLLNYELILHETGKTLRETIELDGVDVDIALTYLTNSCRPAISGTNEVVFSKSPPFRRVWSFKDKEIRLLEDNYKLVWQLFDKSTQTFSKNSLESAFFYDNKYAEIFNLDGPISLGRILGEKTDKENTNLSLILFKDCKIKKLTLKKINETSVYCLEAVFIKRISKKSFIDNSVRINRLDWAITLINSGRSGADPLTWAGHAAILIEGREKTKFFVHKAHLRLIKGEAKVQLHEDTGENVFYSEKRKTWVANSGYVKEMLKAIKWEIKKQEEGDPQILFNLSGAKSKINASVLVTKYISYQEVIEIILGPECLDPKLAIDQPTPFRTVSLIDKDGEKRIETNQQFVNVDQEEFSSPQRFFIEQNDGSWLEVRIPDNCLTWAKTKLSRCGVYLEDRLLDNAYAAPTKYMNGLELQEGATQRHLRIWNRCISHGDLPPLETAILREELIEIKKLLEQGAKITTSHGYTPLHYAADNSCVLTTKFLYEEGMDLLAPSAKYPHSTAFELLLVNNLVPDSSIEFFINSKSAINKRNKITGDTPLHFLAKHYRIKLHRIRFIIEHGADVNAKTNDDCGDTPILLLMKNYILNKQSLYSLVKLLLEKGACANQENNQSETALLFACQKRDKELVQMLIEEGVNLLWAHQILNYFKNPYKVAKMYESNDILSILEDAFRTKGPWPQKKESSYCAVC